MEKQTPHYSLHLIKAIIDKGDFAITRTARICADECFGLDEEGIIRVIRSLTSKDFYKSMTTHADHTIWQDVYKKPISTKSGYYIKLQIRLNNNAVVISFKEDTGTQLK